MEQTDRQTYESQHHLIPHLPLAGHNNFSTVFLHDVLMIDVEVNVEMRKKRRIQENRYKTETIW